MLGVQPAEIQTKEGTTEQVLPNALKHLNLSAVEINKNTRDQVTYTLSDLTANEFFQDLIENANSSQLIKVGEELKNKYQNIGKTIANIDNEVLGKLALVCGIHSLDNFSLSNEEIKNNCLVFDSVKDKEEQIISSFRTKNEEDILDMILGEDAQTEDKKDASAILNLLKTQIGYGQSIGTINLNLDEIYTRNEALSNEALKFLVGVQPIEGKLETPSDIDLSSMMQEHNISLAVAVTKEARDDIIMKLQTTINASPVLKLMFQAALKGEKLNKASVIIALCQSQSQNEEVTLRQCIQAAPSSNALTPLMFTDPKDPTHTFYNLIGQPSGNPQIICNLLNVCTLAEGALFKKLDLQTLNTDNELSFKINENPADKQLAAIG